MQDDSYVNCQTCIENKYLENGIGIPWNSMEDTWRVIRFFMCPPPTSKEVWS